MTRRTFLLMGLAILAVVLSHAAGWGEIAMFQWTDRYRQVTVPNYDLVGSVADYVLLVIRQLTVFAVPAFLFCSGFFVAFAARGSRVRYPWSMVRVRLIDLLIPYLLWSFMWYITDALQGRIYTPTEYVIGLMTGQAAGGSYYFIPLLSQFYLLSPFIVPLAKTRWKLLLIIAGLAQLAAFGVNYWLIFQPDAPAVLYLWRLTSPWLIFMSAFYFPLGVVLGLHSEQFRRASARYYRPALGATAVLALLAILEPEVIYRTTGADMRFVPKMLAPTLYAIFFVVCFVTYDQIKVPLPQSLNQLGKKSYGIYLIQLKAMEFISRLIRQVAPVLLTQPVLIIMPINFIVGLAVPLILMYLVTKSPARKYYHYVFG
jgi:probable poly-beta-1,6-N-acetyl-D-glucosamine export protein